MIYNINLKFVTIGNPKINLISQKFFLHKNYNMTKTMKVTDFDIQHKYILIQKYIHTTP